jgi:hypothetical protein
MSKGGRRSTSWKRGPSGNGSGRPKRAATVEAHKIIADVSELTYQALGTLQEIMEDKRAPPAARVTAATEILSRGWGWPAQPGGGSRKCDRSFLALVQVSFSPRLRPERASACCLRDMRFATRARNVIPSANDPERPFGRRDDPAMAGQPATDGARAFWVDP